MASLTSLSTPGSLQLRSSCRCRESSSVYLRIRFRSSRRRILQVSAALRNTSDGREGQSWTSGYRSPDPFVGWSGSEGDGEGNSEEKGGLGGMLGAGLAGVLFFGGLTFATLSLSSKTSRTTLGMGVKQQMKPLITEQERLLNSGDQNAEIIQVGNGTNAISSDKESEINDYNSDSVTGVSQEVILTSDDQSAEFVQVGNGTNAISSDKKNEINDYSSDSVTGINKDPFPSKDDRDFTEDRHDIINHWGAPSNKILKLTNDGIRSVDSFQRASHEDGWSIHRDVNGISEPPDSKPFPPTLLMNDATDLISDDLNCQELQSVSSDSVVKHNENIRTIDLSSLDTISTDATAEQENPSHKGIFKFSDTFDISSDYVDSPSEPLTSSGIIPESSNYDDSQLSHKDVETKAFILKGNDLEFSGVLQPSSEGLLSGPVDPINTVSSGINSGSNIRQYEAFMFSTNWTDNGGYKLDESPPTLYSSPVYPNPTANERNISTYNRSSEDSAFKSLLPEKLLSFAGVPAPSLVSSALQVPPGKVLVPAVVDQIQSQALAALQVLKVIEVDVQPGDLCPRRDYARWLVSASSALSRNSASKLYPAMYIENVTELAFDDVTPEDPDFAFIQGLAEAGIIFSKLSLSDKSSSSNQGQDPFLFSPESPVSRQDLVSWKIALEKRQLPVADKNLLYQISGFIDIDKIDSAAWPALLSDFSSGEHGITSLAFGYTRLFQPNKPVTKAQVAIALATGDAAGLVGEELARIEAESLAETAVNAHTALVAQVEKDLNASFEQELAKEREKIDAVEKLAEEARLELERIRTEREEENSALLRGRAAVNSEMEVLSRLRSEVEKQLQELMSNKMEISFEYERINKLRKETECENQSVVQLQYELEVERKALSMARTWAEEEAKRARELARVLEEARQRWEKHGIKVIVDGDLQEDASDGITWVATGKQRPVDETISRGESLVEKLNAMATEMKLRSSSVIKGITQKILALISALKQQASRSSKQAAELHSKISLKAGRSIETFKESVEKISSTMGERTRRVFDDCKESVEKISQKFKV